jgi:hypothetical protein
MLFQFSVNCQERKWALSPPPSPYSRQLAILPPSPSSTLFLQGAVQARENVAMAAPLVGAGRDKTPAN